MKAPFLSLALTGVLAIASAPALAAADFDSSIAEARDKVQNSQFAPALDASRKARALNPKDFRSYYYEAMALIGLGRKDEARQAVQAAQERAPASAKASLDKLAQLAGEAASEPAKEATPASGAVFVTCTFVETKRRDKNDQREYTRTWRLERGNFQMWSEERSEWGKNLCVLANYWSKTEKLVDVVHKCEVSDQRFEFVHRRNDGEASISTNWSINRMTGKYYGDYTYESGSYLGGDTGTGTCRGVKDPAAEQKQKF